MFEKQRPEIKGESCAKADEDCAGKGKEQIIYESPIIKYTRLSNPGVPPPRSVNPDQGRYLFCPDFPPGKIAIRQDKPPEETVQPPDDGATQVIGHDLEEQAAGK